MHTSLGNNPSRDSARFGEDLLQSEQQRIVSLRDPRAVVPDGHLPSLTSISDVPAVAESHEISTKAEARRHLYLTVGYRACRINIQNAAPLTITTGVAAVYFLAARSVVAGAAFAGVSIALGGIWYLSSKGLKKCGAELLKIDNTRVPGSLLSVMRLQNNIGRSAHEVNGLLSTDEIELPNAQVTRSFDPSAERRSTTSGGMDNVEIIMPTAKVAEFLRTFWVAVGLKDAARWGAQEFSEEVTHRTDRSLVRDNLDGTSAISIFGNWEPLTDKAKIWLRTHTKLIGNFD